MEITTQDGCAPTAYRRRRRPRRLALFAASALLAMVGAALLLAPAAARAGRPLAATRQAVIYVDAGATGAGTGLGWTDAFTELQQALGMATAGDEIWIAEGVYYPDYDPLSGTYTGDVTATFALVDGVTLYGGFVATETLPTQRDWLAHPTVLSGDLDRNDQADAHGVVTHTAGITGTNAWTVVTGLNVTRTTVLDGLWITAGDAAAPNFVCLVEEACTSGGAVHNTTASPTLHDVCLIGNRAKGLGGAVANILGSRPSISSATFQANRAGYGGAMANLDGSDVILHGAEIVLNEGVYIGGIFNHDSDLTARDVTFRYNYASAGTGGLSNGSGGAVALADVLFYGNVSGSGGAGGMSNGGPGNSVLVNVTFYRNSWVGMINGDSSPTLANVLFYGNFDAGFMNLDHGHPLLVNTTFAVNRGPTGSAIENRDNSSVTLVNSVVWYNPHSSNIKIYNDSTSTADISYSVVELGCPTNSTCDHLLAVDPQYVVAPDPGPDGMWGTRDDVWGDLHLQPTSPAIDSGNTAALPPDTLDIDGDGDTAEALPLDLDWGPRVQNRVVNMGVYEAQAGVAIDKAVVPAGPVGYHTPVTYTILLTSTGTLDALDVVMTDTLPADVSFARWVERPADAELVGSQVRWQGTLTTGHVLTFTFVADHVGEYERVVTNTAHYAFAGRHGEAAAAFLVEERPPFHITKEVSPPVDVRYHGLLTYTVVLTSAAPADALNLLVTDTLPAGVEFDHWVVRPPEAHLVGRMVRWYGTLLANRALTLTFAVAHTGDYGDVVSNTAHYDHHTERGQASALFSVEARPPVTVSKWVTPDAAVAYHAPVTYSVLLQNLGTVDAQDLSLVDVLPPQVRFARWLERPATAHIVSDTLAWHGTLTASRSLTFTWVVSHAGGYAETVTNTAVYTHTVVGGSVSAAFRVQDPPQLALAKTAAPAGVVAYRAPVTYTLLLTNSGTGPAWGVTLRDPLPPEVRFDTWLARPDGAGVIDGGVQWQGAVEPGEVIALTFVVTQAAGWSERVTNTACYTYATGMGQAEAAFVVDARRFEVYLPLVVRLAGSP